LIAAMLVSTTLVLPTYNWLLCYHWFIVSNFETADLLLNLLLTLGYTAADGSQPTTLLHRWAPMAKQNIDWINTDNQLTRKKNIE
jgi:hypothetical protein